MPLLMDDQCDCEFPVLWEMGNPLFLGRMVRVRLCCLMRDMEARFGTSYHQVWDAEPRATWNEERTGQEQPDWLGRRIAEKMAMGYAMEAPIEDEANAQRLADEAVELGYVAMDDKGNIVPNVGRMLEKEIKATEQPHRVGRKMWERDQVDAEEAVGI